MKRKSDKITAQMAVAIIIIFVVSGTILGGVAGYKISKAMSIPYTKGEISTCTEIARNIYENGAKTVSDEMERGNYDISITRNSKGMVILFKNVPKEKIQFEFYGDELPKCTIIKTEASEYIANIIFFAMVGFILSIALLWLISNLILFITKKIIELLIFILKKFLGKSRKDDNLDE